MDSRQLIRLPTRDVVRVLALIFGFYVLVRLLWIAHPVVFLFFLGVLFGLPLAQGTDWLEKRKVPRAIGTAVILTVFLGLLTAGAVGMAPILRAQSKELQDRLPEAMDKIDAWLGHRANGVLGILFNEESSSDTLRTAATQRGAIQADSTEQDEVVLDSALTEPQTVPAGAVAHKPTTRADTVAAGGNLRHEITKQFRGAQNSFLRMLTSTFAVTGAFLLVLFIAAYIAVDPHLYHGGILEMVPVRERDRAAVVAIPLRLGGGMRVTIASRISAIPIPSLAEAEIVWAVSIPMMLGE